MKYLPKKIIQEEIKKVNPEIKFEVYHPSKLGIMIHGYGVLICFTLNDLNYSQLELFGGVSYMGIKTLRRKLNDALNNQGKYRKVYQMPK